MINQAQLQPQGVVQVAHDPKGELSIRYKRAVFFFTYYIRKPELCLQSRPSYYVRILGSGRPGV
jgi:hypothetical protein